MSLGIFPVRLLDEVVLALRDRNAQFVTYRDVRVASALPEPLSVLPYVLEYARSKSAMGRGGVIGRAWLFTQALLLALRSSAARGRVAWSTDAPPTVILQHDADRVPESTVAMMERESELGARSSAFFFFERHVWDSDTSPYTLPIARLQALEKRGFEVGYHLNAYELASYDWAEAQRLILRDVSWFRQHFTLNAFVPHGGRPAPDGRNNCDVRVVPALRGVMWAYNGRRLHGLIKDVTWSDGGLESRSVEDPRAVARALRCGQRALFLMHPQYYGEQLVPDWARYPVAKLGWWRELWGL